jgi:hypothetical protein
VDTYSSSQEIFTLGDCFNPRSHAGFVVPVFPFLFFIEQEKVSTPHLFKPEITLTSGEYRCEVGRGGNREELHFRAAKVRSGFSPFHSSP